MFTRQSHKGALWNRFGGAHRVLYLRQSINDSRLGDGQPRTFHATDASTDTVAAVTGASDAGTAVVAVTPLGANNGAPSFLAEDLETLNLGNGQVGQAPLGSQKCWLANSVLPPTAGTSTA